jgi:L-asparaginase/Glu-tRNA(Gln) amidotransferase subunit D
MNAPSGAKPSGGPIGLVITGGTIGSEVSEGITDVSGRAEAALVRSAADYAADVRVMRAMRKLSENMRPDDWVVIANSVRKLVADESVTGILVLHGTDTMAYTAAALSFLLADLEQPVVLTGANIPMLEPASDAMTNMSDAVCALSGLSTRGMGGIYVCFSGIPSEPSQLLAGVNVRKSIASGHAYESVNREPIARIQNGSFDLKSDAPQRHPYPSALMKVDPSVTFLRVMPGVDFAREADHILESAYSGVVVELYPTWTGPTWDDQFSLLNFIEKLVHGGIIVATTVANASKHEYEYASEAVLRRSGALVLAESLPETAYVKLMWALGQNVDTLHVQELMLTNIAGELGSREVTTADTGSTTA